NFPGCYELFLTAFTLLVVAIGIVFAALPVVMVLRLLSPHPSVRIESLKVEAGRPGQISWRLRGRRGWLRRLTITLEGREEATYADDEIFRTAREVFYANELLAAE